MKAMITGAQPVPLWRQHERLTAQYPETVLLYCMNDCVAALDAQAPILGELGAVVATVDNDGRELPIARLHWTEAEATVKRLLDAGRKVVMVERLGGGPEWP